MKKRTQAREYAVQMMYQATMMESVPTEVIPVFWKSFNETHDDVREFAEKLFIAAFDRVSEHDNLVMQFLKDSWPFDRLGEIEKCVLRVAVDEMLYSDTPAYAILDDYVTLTRRFTDEKTAAFVNGLLDNIRNSFGNGERVK